MVYHHGWQIDPEAFRRALTPQTRALVLVHPNNPTGHFTKPWEAEELGRLCREHSLALIVDEVFLDYPLANSLSVPHPVAVLPGDWVGEHEPQPAGPPKTFASGVDGVPVFVVSGLSKIAGLPQMKAAWIVATGPDPDRTQSLARLEIIADTFLSMNAPVQCALPAWLDSRFAIQREIQARVAANLAELDRRLASVPAPHRLVDRLALEGGWYAVLRIPALAPDEATVLALLERGVWVHPGYYYGLPPSGWLVLSLLPPVTEFHSGVTKIVDYLHKNQRSNITG
jgi:alanine-synthesizing transaminase